MASVQGDDTFQGPDTSAPALASSSDPGLIARGRELVYGPAHCAQCHAMTDRTKPEGAVTEPLSGGLTFEMGPVGTLYGRNLPPDPEPGIGRRTDAELTRVLRTGVLPDGTLSVFMRYSAAKLSDEDIVAVLGFLRAQPPVRNEVPPGEVGTVGKIVFTCAFTATPRDEPAPTDVARGPEPTGERDRAGAGVELERTGGADEEVGAGVGRGAVDARHEPREGAADGGVLDAPAHVELGEEVVVADVEPRLHEVVAVVLPQRRDRVERLRVARGGVGVDPEPVARGGEEVVHGGEVGEGRGPGVAGVARVARVSSADVWVTVRVGLVG